MDATNTPNTPRTFGVSRLSLLLGIWLLIAPFMLGYNLGVATWNDIILGILVAGVALLRTFGNMQAGTSWLNVVFGIWLIIAPFALNYADHPAAWFAWRRFVGILALVVFATFPGVALNSSSFVFRDFGLFGYPLAHYFRESFWRGEVPLWNPLNNCGLPFLAQWNTLVCYPPSLIYLLLPLPWSLNLFCLLHLMLAGVTMYFLALRWTSSGLAASVAGLAFVFSGSVLSTLIWPNYIATLAWVPAVILCCERAWCEGGRRVVLAGLVGAIQMLAGTPELIFFTWLIVLALWMDQVWA